MHEVGDWRRMQRSIERLIDDIDLLAARGLPRKEFFAELSPRLRKVIDNDASCWHTLDPHTRLMTSDDPAELIGHGIFAPDETPAAGELLVRSEYMIEDVNTFAGLAARRVPVGILDHATQRQPGEQRALPRPAAAGGHPTRAPWRVRHPRSRVGRGAHRPPCRQRAVPAA